MSKSMEVLGDVNISNIDHYTVPTEEEVPPLIVDGGYKTPESNVANENSRDLTVSEEPPKLHPKPKRASSEGESFSCDTNQTPELFPHIAATMTDRTALKEPINSTSTEEKSQKRKHGSNGSRDNVNRKTNSWKCFAFFGRKEKYKTHLEDYEEVTFGSQNRIQAKQLINKSLTLSGLESICKGPCKFTKVVPVGTDRIGLLSTFHLSVVIAQLDGMVCSRKTNFRGIISIASLENDQLAILTLNEDAKLHIVLVKGKEFQTKDTFDIKADISDVTGFDYSQTKTCFAIGTRRKQLLIDVKGKELNSTDIENETGLFDIVTTYDFEKDNIFILNIKQKAIKCVHLTDLRSVWKRKCEDEQFEPKSMCLYKDQLFVATPCTITIFAAGDGHPIIKHSTADLVTDCFGVCVLDGVVVVSSNSEEFDESRKLAFISP